MREDQQKAMSQVVATNSDTLNLHSRFTSSVSLVYINRKPAQNHSRAFVTGTPQQKTPNYRNSQVNPFA